MVTLTACPKLQDTCEGRWYVKNCTKQELIYQAPSMPGRPQINIPIAENDSVMIQVFAFTYKEGNNPYFEAIYLRPGSDADFSRMEIQSSDKTLLRRWELAEKDEPGKQFFNESSWFYQEKYVLNKYWTFEITPEDIE